MKSVMTLVALCFTLSLALVPVAQANVSEEQIVAWQAEEAQKLFPSLVDAVVIMQDQIDRNPGKYPADYEDLLERVRTEILPRLNIIAETDEVGNLTMKELLIRNVYMNQGWELFWLLSGKVGTASWEDAEAMMDKARKNIEQSVADLKKLYGEEW